MVALTIPTFTILSSPTVKAETQGSEAQILSYTWYVSSTSTLAEWVGDLVAAGEVQNTGTTTIGSVWIFATAYNSTGAILDQAEYKALAIDLLPMQISPFFLDFQPEYSPTQDQSWVSSVTNVSVAILSVIDTNDTMYSGLTIATDSITGFNNAGTYTVKGTIQNTGTQTTGKTWAVTTFYNASGTVVALNFTNYLADSLAPGSSVQFTATPADNTAALSNQITNYRVLVQARTLTTTVTPTPTQTSTESPTSTPAATATQSPGTSASDLTYITIIAAVAVVAIVAALLLVRLRRSNRQFDHLPPSTPPASATITIN
jgi:hypothetical protein